MDDKGALNITVIIAGRPFPLTIKPNEEAAIRQIVKDINGKINQLQRTYAHKDKMDYLCMTILTYAVDLHKEHQNKVDSDISKKLDVLNALLDNSIYQ